MEYTTSNIIYAAGGLVWKDSPEGKKIAVVYRNKYGDWSLPKGKMEEADKNLEQTALREVREETGVEAEITGLAGCVHYTVQGKTKFVIFYHMSANTGIAESLHKDVQKCQWLSVAEAYKKLTYKREKLLFSKSLPFLKKIRIWITSRLRFLHSSLQQRRRLTASINSLRNELFVRTESDTAVKNKESWRIELAFRMLEMSERHITDGSVSLNEAWEYFHRARKMSVWSLTSDELKSTTLSLKPEISKKLAKSWRSTAIENLLTIDKNDGTIPPVEQIAEAISIRDEHFSNQYFKIELIGRQIGILLLMVVANLFLIGLLLNAWPAADGGIPLAADIPEIDVTFLSLIFLFGMLGGILTTLVSIVRSESGGTIPECFLDWKMTIARPGLGGAAAIVVFLGTNAGIPGLSADTIGAAFFIAVASGFTERILIGALQK